MLFESLPISIHIFNYLMTVAWNNWNHSAFFGCVIPTVGYSIAHLQESLESTLAPGGRMMLQVTAAAFHLFVSTDRITLSCVREPIKYNIFCHVFAQNMEK